MRAWKAVVLLNAALAASAGWGYVVWGLPSARLERALAEARGPAAGEREWQVRGVIRAVLPEINVLVVTHDDIPGYMEAMTMGFRAASPAIYEGVEVGDQVRFTLRGTPPYGLAVTAIEKLP